MEGRPYRVLIIEDNAADARLIQLAWEECEVAHVVSSVLADSRDTIRFLRGFPPYPQAPPPDLVVLDYRMPVNGGVALTEIKGDPDYLHIPILVLTASQNPKDYLDAYQRGANCCYQKPVGLNAHMKLICEIAEHWLYKVTLPNGQNVPPGD